MSDNNPNNIGNSWRPGTLIASAASTLGMAASAVVTVPSVESVLSMQKRGAERLFQYMEADGSDPEDYARYERRIRCSLMLLCLFRFRC